MEILTAAETSLDQLLSVYSAGRIGRRELLAVADALATRGGDGVLKEWIA